jgi:hypothetical protein
MGQVLPVDDAWQAAQCFENEAHAAEAAAVLSNGGDIRT